jgi:putative MATE family efflux protein
MQKNSERQQLPNYTEGSILRSLIMLAIPIVFANILQTAYQLTDTFWVGRLGAEAIAAVSLSFPINFLMLSMGGGLFIAGSILVAQNKGKGDLKEVDYISAQTMLMLVVVSAIMSPLGYFLAEPIMKLIGAEGNVLPDAVAYLQITFIGSIFLFGYFAFQALMRGVGDVKTPIYIVLMTVVLNFFLDPLLIFGWGPVPGMGVAGAALATIICQGVAMIWGMALLFSGKYGIHLKLKNFHFDMGLLKRMFMLGLPSSVEQSARAIGLTLMSFLVASFGTITIAAYGLGTRVFSFVIIPAIGFAMATSTLVGQNMGAGKIDRAEKVGKTAAMISFVFLTLIGIIVFIFARSIVTLFIPNDADVIDHSVVFIRIFSLSFGVVGLQQTLNGVFMGSGNTFISMMIAIISLWVIQFPLAYILSQHTSLGELGIWLAFPISPILASIIAIYWFMHGTWKKKKLVSESTESLQDKVIEESIIEEGIQ